MLEGILFDVDGVLVDSEELCYAAIKETFMQYGVEISRDEYVRRWMIEQTTTPGVITDYGLEATADEIRDNKSNNIIKFINESLELMPGALELLDLVYKRFPLGVVSSAYREHVAAKLGKFGLLSRFEIVVSKSDTTYIKPHPEPYELGTKLLGIHQNNVLVIEDNPSGVKSAKAAGCKVIAYPNGFTSDLDFSEADAVVDGLNKIDNKLLYQLF